MTFSLDPVTLSIFYKLVVAMACGLAIGTERIIAHKSAGMRTYALVTMASALFIILGNLLIRPYLAAGLPGVDPYHIPAAIITGIGFMGAGIFILRSGNGTSNTGLTTASGLWVASGIGMAAGYGFFSVAILSTLLTLFVFVVLWYVEQVVRKFSKDDSSNL